MAKITIILEDLEEGQILIDVAKDGVDEDAEFLTAAEELGVYIQIVMESWLDSSGGFEDLDEDGEPIEVSKQAKLTVINGGKHESSI